MKSRNTELRGGRPSGRRRHTEKTLIASEARLAEAQRIARIGSWEWDIDSDGLWWSEETFRIFGLDPEKFSADFDAFIGAVHPDDRQRVRESVAQAVRDQVSEWTIDYRSVLPGGEIRYLHENARAVFAPDGRLVKRVGTVQDITERKLAEQALTLREREYHTLLDNIPDLIVRYDTELRRTYVNLAWEKASGLSQAEVVNVAASAIPRVQKPIIPEYEQKLRRVLKSGTIETCEFFWKNAFGTELFLEFVIVPEHDRSGGIIGALAIGRDLSERQRTERLAQVRLRMVEVAHTAGITLDDTLRRMLDEIEAQTGSRIGFYHFLAEDQQTISLQSWSTNTVATMCAAEGKGRHYPVAEAGVWADCVRERRPVIHNDYASLPRRQGLPAGHAPVVRELVVPVFRGPRIVAIIGVGNKPEVYIETDVQIASLLGDFSWEIVIRKQAEESLRRSEARLTEAQRIARLGNWELDLTSNILLWSDEIYRIFEIDPARFGTSYEAFLDAIHPDDREMVNHAYTRSVADRIPYAITHRLLMKDGRIKYVEEHCETSYDEDGRPLRSMGTVHDVTDRKLAEEEVLALNQQLERRVAERTAELEAKNLELERINQLFIGRELKMVELKKRLKKFEGER